MKMRIVVAAGLALFGHATATKSMGATFGPKGCVMLTRSSKGSCVISTDCENADLSQTEFAFDCVGAAGAVRHSFGTGGFENNEEFDTDITCNRCDSLDVKTAAKVPKKSSKATAKLEAPQHVPAAVIFKVKSKHSVKVASQAKSKFWPFTSTKEEARDVVKYGPGGCVSTWRSAKGNCVIKTDCAKSNIDKYGFGLICVDKLGAPVRHTFGKGSFDTEETFDTLIKCDKCLGLEDIPDAVALNGEVVTMSKDVAELKAVMTNISINVQMLNEEVFKSAPAPAPAPAAAADAPAAAVSFSVHHRDNAGAKRNLRHSREREENDDEDEDEEDDDDDESEED